MTFKQTMTTRLEDFSVELFCEIFTYFQLHEIWNIFSSLNSRLNGIIENFPFKFVYLGFDGMNIEVTDFYYKYLSQANISARLTSLCVSDAISIDNGLWFAEHGSTLINLRHLSLIDIRRSTFELILSSLSPINSITMFSVNFFAHDRAACTFRGVPEGAYHERIFHLFPSLRVCHLYFRRHIHYTVASPFVLPLNEVFMPIHSSLFNLRSLAISHCSLSFLSHLFEHLPQLEQFSGLMSYTHWLPPDHPPVFKSDK